MDEKVVIQQRPPKSPALAGILALIPFGTGAFYNGQYLKGLLYFISFAGLITINTHGAGQPFTGLLLAGFIIFQFFESIQAAKAINLVAAGQKPEDAAKADFLPDVIRAGSIFWGIILIVIGVLVTLTNFDVLTWETLWHFWPVPMIIFGLKLIYDSHAKAKNGN
jgi:hypothetical protein